jgi:hypothetical protein
MTENLNLLDHNIDASQCPPVTIGNGSEVAIEKGGAPNHYLLLSQIFFIC